MAIEYYSSIDLNQNEIQRPVIHVSGAINDGDGVKGQLYTHSTDNVLYFHNGTTFIDLTAGDISGVTAGNGLSGGGSTGAVTLTLDISDSSLTTETSIAQADLLAFSDESASNDPTKNITFSNFEDTIFSNMNSASSDVAVAAGGAITLANDCVDSAEIADGAIDTVHIADSQVTNAKLQYSSVQIGASTVSLGNALTSLTALTDIDLTSGNKTIFDGVGSNTLTIGASGTTITIPGNLVVSGTQTIQNETVQIVENNTILFEGTTADANEIKLTGGDPTADRVVTLPDATGTVALTSDITGTNSGTNTGDQLVFKTVSTDSGSAVADTTTDTLTLSGGAGIDTSASADTITIAAETASATNAGIVELADSSEAKAGSGAGKVIDASQLGARSVTGTIATASITGNRRVQITHNLATEDVIVQLFDASTKQTIYADVYRTEDDLTTASTNIITVDFGNAPENNIEFIITSAAGATNTTTLVYT